MICPGKRLGAIFQPSREAILHGKKAAPHVAVIVDKVFDVECNPISGSKNDAEFRWQRLLGRSCEHFRIAAELNRKVWFWRSGELRVPNLVSAGIIQDQKVCETRKPIIFQCCLINDGGPRLDRQKSSALSLFETNPSDFDQARG